MINCALFHLLMIKSRKWRRTLYIMVAFHDSRACIIACSFETMNFNQLAYAEITTLCITRRILILWIEKTYTKTKAIAKIFLGIDTEKGSVMGSRALALSTLPSLEFQAGQEFPTHDLVLIMQWRQSAYHALVKIGNTEEVGRMWNYSQRDMYPLLRSNSFQVSYAMCGTVMAIWRTRNPHHASTSGQWIYNYLIRELVHWIHVRASRCLHAGICVHYMFSSAGTWTKPCTATTTSSARWRCPEPSRDCYSIQT